MYTSFYLISIITYHLSRLRETDRHTDGHTDKQENRRKCIKWFSLGIFFLTDSLITFKPIELETYGLY